MHCRSTSERQRREPAEQHDRSGEWVVGAAANSASIMRELNPVPFEQWHGPWSDCRQRRPVPSARGVKAVLGFVTLLPLWAATGGPDHAWMMVTARVADSGLSGTVPYM